MFRLRCSGYNLFIFSYQHNAFSLQRPQCSQAVLDMHPIPIPLLKGCSSNLDSFPKFDGLRGDMSKNQEISAWETQLKI